MRSSSIHDSISQVDKDMCKMYDSPDKSEKYLIGIIDILTLFDTRKKMEYCFKRLIHGDGISAVPPEQYAERFYEFVRGKVFN
mgnify:FL=1|jgi:1-phosphatidylinositol-4-phosphate 5-kinase